VGAAPPTVMPVCAKAGKENVDTLPIRQVADKEARNAEHSFMANL
jgi:hypothetical protein